jgi:hypothetical protein
VQGWPEQDFAQRLFVYHYRIFDRYNRQVVTLAVLADDRPSWPPDRFAYDEWGCRLDFQFPVVKLLDFAGREAVLEASDNPFALVTRAHLATMQKAARSTIAASGESAADPRIVRSWNEPRGCVAVVPHHRLDDGLASGVGTVIPTRSRTNRTGETHGLRH